MRRASVVVALALATVGLGGVPAGADLTTLVVDDHGQATATARNDTTTTAYMSVQAAVTAASLGDTIHVCPGTCTEQVTIATNNPTLQSVVTAMRQLPAVWYIDPKRAMIKAPAGMTREKAIVHVDGATGVTTDGFQINGPGGRGCDSIR